MVNFDTEKMLNPSIIGGIVNGVLGAICCLGYIVGGAVAAHLYVNAGGSLDYENCGVVGAISGVIGGIIATILSFLILASIMPMMEFKSYAFLAGTSIIIGLISGIIFGAILGAIGGILYVVIKNR
ncbi:conserved membrane protein of unknown function [Methanocaldococcus lauensis]|uniref:DUF5518 domain-containing protein n=1 Tax=Methanocaldococcus lauensis TaxID=2546128 RepID=A0A8D6SV40_9EURY|nr:DUF5518 domain-containing protein [Methanocaldococcus lauensis]CAB3289282.1 conserved membrane protein of unknown function [Methanocaldococcus lauensis]